MKRYLTSLKKCICILMAVAMVLGCGTADPLHFGAGAAFADEKTPAELLYDYFNAHKATGTALEIPFGTGEGEFTNAQAFVKAECVKVLKAADPDMEISENDIEVSGKWGAMPGTVGSGTPLMETVMDSYGNLTQTHENPALNPSVQKLDIAFKGQAVDQIGNVYFHVAPLSVSEQEKVDMEASVISWDYIKAANKSADYVVNPLGQTSGSTTSLKAAPAVFNAKDKNNPDDKGVTVEYSIRYDGEGDDPGCLKLAGGKTTITRPNVGEEDAPYTITAKVTSNTDTDITTTIDIPVTIPAFAGCEVPFRLSPADATITITDSVYKAPVAEKYITAGSEEGLKTAILHKSVTDGNQSFDYVVEREGYVTKKGSVAVNGNMPEVAVTLTQSSEDDTKLSDLIVTDPVPGSVNIKTPMAAFDPDTTEYSMTVGAVDSITIQPEAAVAGATVSVNYHTTATNAKKGTFTKKTVNPGATLRCYLKPGEAEAITTDITITVTAPAGSSQAVKTKDYVIHVTRGYETFPMEGLTLTTTYKDGMTSNAAKNNRVTPAEETLTPAVNSGGIENRYVYTVNYLAESVTLKPTAAASAKSIKINGETVANKANSAAIPLAEGNNNIKIEVVGSDDHTYEYNILVHKKKELSIKKLEIEGGASFEPALGWVASMNFPKDADTFKLKVYTAEGSKISVTDVAGTYDPEQPITIPTNGSDKFFPDTTISTTYTIDCEEWTDSQVYVTGFRRIGPEGADSVVSYLPAPGQFVNLDSYNNPLRTLGGISSSGMVTLGSFGGSIVYYFDEPLTDDNRNPYGVDFIVFGNVFANSDGSSSAGASEPASVMVSDDGKTWYELAGSSYYDGAAKHNIKVTYTNNDTQFKQAEDVPWRAQDGSNGLVLKNSYHKQPYYPNPAIYDKYNVGVSANSTYGANSVSFTGTLCNWYFTPYYGYGDAHLQNVSMGNTASNPYAQNHYVDCNGDGMDLAWAVDEKGTPVSMSGKNIHYVKIYNPIIFDGGARGEISPEIQGIVRAKAANVSDNTNGVGKSSPLTKFEINGKEVTVKATTFNYTFDAKGASTLKVKPTATNANANIIVNDQYVVSGTDSHLLMGTDKFRIIVQEGNKTPLIYTITVNNVKTPAKNADLKSVSLIPGEIGASRDSEGNFTAEIPADTSAVRIKAVPMNNEAKVAIESDRTATEDNDWTGGDNIAVPAGGSKEVNIAVTSKDGTVSKTVKLTINRKAETSQAEQDAKIKVTFTLVGDENHGTPESHKKFETWIEKTTVSVNKGATVKELTDKMLIDNNMPFTTKSHGNYIAEINGLGEFDNGPNSGWMYSVNGVEPEEGYGTYVLSAGDNVKWFYTDDYTKEESSKKWNKDKNQQEAVADEQKPTGEAPAKQEVKETVTPEAKVDAKGEAAVKVDADDMKAVIAEAKSDAATNIEIAPKGAENASKITVDIPKESIESVGRGTAASLTVKSDIGEVKIPNAELKVLATGGKSGDVSITIEKVKDAAGSDTGAVKFELAAGGSKVEKTEKPIVAAIPAANATAGMTMVLVHEDGSEEILKKSVVEDGKAEGLVPGSCVVKLVDKAVKFADSANHWGKSAIDFVSSRGIFNGVSATAFDPNAKTGRGMVVTALCRLEDGKANGAAKYGDVQSGQWYSDSVAWADENGIVTGDGNGFNPNGLVSREAIATMLYRYAKYLGLDTSVKASINAYGDAANVAPWAKDSMAWAIGSGIIRGNEKGNLAPGSEASRVEFATMIERMVKCML